MALKTSQRFVFMFALMAAGCGPSQESAPTAPPAGSFGDDLAFLEQHGTVVVLSGAGGQAQVAVVGEMQGRVMTSTLAGPEGLSLGWINRDLIASRERLEHINPYGGEDRFWMGPEGGQFSIFFAQGDPFNLEHWFTPAPLDTEPFDLVSSDRSQVLFSKSMSLVNYSGTRFNVQVDREIRLLGHDQAAEALGLEFDPATRLVAFASHNAIRNAGEVAWTPQTGLLSIWILGMFNSSPRTTVVIPFIEGAEQELGPVVNDAYFGEVPADRLVVGEGVLFFKADSKYRSKIGLMPSRAKPVLGSYDAVNAVLTIVQYSKPQGVNRYVNSMWEMQEAPYGGDVINAYNDGAPGPGAKQLGPFYELETSSPAAELEPGQSLSHIHTTFHFQGTEAVLDAISRRTLGVTLADIRNAL